jgi:hypothetical protein
MYMALMGYDMALRFQPPDVVMRQRSVNYNVCSSL